MKIDIDLKITDDDGNTFVITGRENVEKLYEDLAEILKKTEIVDSSPDLPVNPDPVPIIPNPWMPNPYTPWNPYSPWITYSTTTSTSKENNNG